jgi:hypothetical protein
MSESRFKAVRSFYWRWFKAIFHYKEHWHTPWRITAAVATGLSVVVPPAVRFIAHRWFPSSEAAMGDLVWQIPLGIFALLGMSRFVLAPYWLYQEKELQAQEFAVIVEAKNREISQAQRSVHSADLPQPAPTLEIAEVVIKPATRNMMDIWKINYYSGVPVLTVLITNVAAAVGKSTSTAEDVAVTIKFKNATCTQIGHVSRAYWFQYSANNISIQSGEQEMILVGSVDGDSFIIFDNPRKHPVVPPRYALSSFRPPKGHFDVFPLPAQMDMELKVISTETGKTYCTRTARLTKEGNKVNVVML